MDLYRGMNAGELEYQYELRSKEADFDAVVARWLKRSAALRDSRDVAIDLAYGSGDRDKLDLYRAAAGGPLLVYITAATGNAATRTCTASSPSPS